MKTIIFYFLLLLYCLLLLNIIHLNKRIRENNYSEIVLSKESDLYNMFKKSVSLYNERITYINNIYKKIKIYKGNKKVIAVLLTYKEIKPFINRNYMFIKQNFHDKLLFYVTENKTLKEEYRNIKYSVIDISDIFFRFPYNFNSNKIVSNYRKRGIWNYQHMCRFFFRDIFLHPSLYDVDIYMRLDSESILNTTVNLFEYMKRDIVYMHNRVFNDANFVVRGLKQFVESLVKGMKVEIKDVNNYSKIFKRTVLSYYNNFEICRMNFFRSKEMFQFINLVDLSYGQFIYRWGDAPLRYISLSLYAENYTKISLPKQIKYCHKDCNK